MKKLVVLLMVSLMATSAFAVVDPDPDMLGVYFDTDANNNCATYGVYVQQTAYVILTNPTVSNIEAFEFSYNNVIYPPGVDANVFMLAQRLPAGAINVGEGTPTAGNVIAGLATPVPPTPAAVLVEWDLMLGVAAQMDIYLGASVPASIAGDLPVIQGEGTGLQQVGLSTGGSGIPVAVINGECPVAVESNTWGGVKSLYR